MLARAILWLATSKIGQTVAIALAGAAALGLALLKAFSAGRQTERTAQDRRSLENLRSRQRVEDEVQRMPYDERSAHLKEWSSRE